MAWTIFSYSAPCLYSVLMHKSRGQTLGKMATHVKVLDIREERIPSLKQALLRDIGNVVLNSATLAYVIYLIFTHGYEAWSDALGIHMLECASIVWFLLEVSTMLTNSRRRALHDLIAGTVVVRIS